MLLVDQRGICHGHKIIRLHEAEIDAGISILDTYSQQIAPLLRRRVRIVAADGAYSGPRMRLAARAAGLVESCHPVSHADKEISRKNARTHAVIGGAFCLSRRADRRQRGVARPVEAGAANRRRTP